jgi:hypothetical protein
MRITPETARNADNSRDKNMDYSYTPKSDFLILKYSLPRLAVEVNSYSPGRPAVDHYRLMLQGASMVRFANNFLGAYKTERNFVFVAIFIGDTGVADRYLMFQKRNSEKVRTYALYFIKVGAESP